MTWRSRVERILEKVVSYGTNGVEIVSKRYRPLNSYPLLIIFFVIRS